MANQGALDGSNRTIGVASSSWFARSFIGATLSNNIVTEVSVSSLDAAIIQDGHPLASAHELGHTYGLYTGTELYQMPDACPGSASDSTVGATDWVQVPQFIPSTAGLENYMCSYNATPGITLPAPLAIGNWTTSNDFAFLLSKFETAAADPEVINLSGYVEQNGAGSFVAAYRSTTGVPDDNPTGAYTIQILNRLGSVLSAISFTPDFNMYVQGADPISSGISPFLFSLPYSPNAIEAQLVNSNGTVLATSQISTSLLNQAINALDDTAFAGSPSLQRNDILSGIATLDAQESAGKWIGAQTTLQSILSQLSSDLLDSYNPPSILVCSKSSLIALGNELMQRLVLNTADVNGDGVVNCADLAIVKASFGKKTGQPGFNPIADVNADGIVNVLDLSAVAKQVPAGTVCQ